SGFEVLEVGGRELPDLRVLVAQHVDRVEVCFEHRDRLTVSIHEIATTDASHPHPRDTVRLLSELHIRERSSRRIDVRNQRSQTRASRPLATRLRCRCMITGTTPRLCTWPPTSTLRPCWRSTQTVWFGRYKVTFVGVTPCSSVP